MLCLVSAVKLKRRAWSSTDLSEFLTCQRKIQTVTVMQNGRKTVTHKHTLVAVGKRARVLAPSPRP